MTIYPLLAQLREKQVNLWVENGDLHYQAPPNVLTPELIAQLRTHKNDIIALINEANRTPFQLRPYPQNPTELLPLSFSQERFWFLDKLGDETAPFNIVYVAELNGRLDTAALQNAANTLAERHTALQTIFPDESRPVQQHKPSLQPGFVLEDLSGLPEEARKTRTAQKITAVTHHRFNLKTGPLIHFHLLKTAPNCHILLITMHHIIADGWSLRILIRELSELYTAQVNGRSPNLPPLPIQYTDYAIWQREGLQGQILEQQLQYWQTQLTGAPPTLNLPTDHPRPAIQTYQGAEQTLPLPTDIQQKLQTLAEQHNASLFMVLLAAFQLLVSRLAGQEDVVIGTPISGRSQPEVQNVIGYFINMLAIRTDLTKAPTFSALLNQIRQTTLSAFAHQTVPFEHILEAIAPPRDPGRTPVFQLLFNMLNLGDVALSLPGITAKRLRGDNPEAKFDLTLYVEETADSGHNLRLVYNTALFTQARMAAFLAQYHHLLRQIAANPEMPIQHYSLAAPDTTPSLPDPTQPLPSLWAGDIPTRFEQQAAAHPEKTAVSDPHDNWTYHELNTRSSQLAHALQQNGIQPGDLIAIYAHRSASLVWALLGTLKAGAAFLILDPAYPPERLRAMLTQANPTAWLQLEAAPPPPKAVQSWLAQANLRAQFTLPRHANIASSPFWQNLPASPPPRHIQPDQRMYVVFTSGSTGQPKGIVGTHKPVSHFLAWQAQRFGFTPGDRFSLLSGLGHDPLLRDIFAPLWSGAALFIPDPDQLLAPGYLAAWMGQHGITQAHLTPAMAQLLAMAGADVETAVSTLKHAFFGGEPLTKAVLEKWHDIAPCCTAVNFYGTTETPQAMAYAILPDKQPPTTAPLGKGIDGVQLLVLTAAGQLAGVDEPGEIVVRTPYLAQGYLNPADNNGRFATNPFTRQPQDRIYHTGDYGRYLPDGSVSYIGRRDTQVNIRGFRVEVAEIEATLKAHPQVQTALVLPTGSPHEQLHAFVVTTLQPEMLVQTLSPYLEASLPAYMRPAAITAVPAIPLTPNGKVDKAALLQYSETAVVRPQAVHPQTPLEAHLQQIWEKTLNVSPIYTNNNFFELGGYSLQAVALLAEVERTFGQKLSLAFFLQSPTIAAMAKALSPETAVSTSQQWQSLVPIQPTGSRPPFFVVHGIGGHVLRFRQLASHLPPDQPFYGLQVPYLNDKLPKGMSVPELARLYLSEIKSVQPQGPYYLGGFCFGCVVALEMAKQLREAGEQCQTLVFIDPLNMAVNRQPVNQNLAKHRETMAHMRPHQRLRYLASRSFYRARTIWQRQKRRYHKYGFKLIGFRLTQLLGLPVPAHWRYLYIQRVNGRALFTYQPTPQPGPAILFQSQDTDERGKGWDKLITDNLTIHAIPTPHLNLLQEPNITTIATLLQTHFDTIKKQP